MSKLKKTVFLCGRFGSGKSTIALNLALYLSDAGVDISLVDLDVFNPYFRSSDMSPELTYHGVSVLSPKATDVAIADEDILPKITSKIDAQNSYVILDIGDDESGSTVMRNISAKMGEFDYDLLYVVNFTKAVTKSPEAAAADIEKYCKSIGFCCTGIINNSHVANLTNGNVIEDSVADAKKLSELTNLPVFYNCFDKNMNMKNIDGALPLEIYVTPSWYHKKK